MNAEPQPCLLVLGDVMLDLYTWGRVERLSPEAPVLVLEVEREEARLGGAGAVAALAAGLGVQPILLGVLGNDPPGRVVARLVAELGNRGQGTGNRAQVAGDRDDGRVDPPLPPGEGRGGGRGAAFGSHCTSCPNPGSLFAASDRPTTVKERFIGVAAGRHGQQMLRVDRESRRPLPHEFEEQLRRAAVAALDHVQAVLISDYGKGVCTPGLLSAVIRAARRRRVPVLADPRRGGDYELYRWATVIKPNRREASEATGVDIRCVADACVAGQALCARGNFQAAVITLDVDGMVLVTADGDERHFASSDREVCDVTGAGDTVLAVLGHSLASGRSLVEACELANLAAGLQVERLGVAPLTREEVEGSGFGVQGSEEEKAEDETKKAQEPRPKTQSLNPKSKIENSKSHFSTALDSYRASGQTIVLANGCFDLLHAGHVHCLRAAAALGDVLIVAINSDASVRRLKGEARPIVGQQERAAMLAALDCVDHVVIFDDDTPERLIADIRPDVLLKGAEERPVPIPGADLVAGYGGRVELVPLLPGISTTTILERLLATTGKKRITQEFKVQGSKFKVPNLEL